jgi:hypothetical protein
VAIGVLVCAGCDRDKAVTASKALTLVVSGDTGGWLTPCGCASNQSGGLLRRGTYIDGLRKGGGRVVYLDAGGAAGGSSDYHKEKFEAILRGEKLMGIEAHNLGKAEVAFGAAYLRDLPKRVDVPLISANVRDEKGELVTRAYNTVTIAGVRVLVVGVVSPKFAAAGLAVGDPRQAVLDVLSQAKGMDWKIVLAYLPEEELNQLAASLPEVDAVIGGPTGQAISPRKVGPVTLAAATNKGKFLVKLSGEGNSGLTGEVVQVGPDIADSPAQTENLAAYLKRLGERDFSANESGLVESAVGLPADYRFAGSASCASCHQTEDSAWHSSKHSHAVETLEGKGFHVDSYCQSCHTTGFGMSGGFEKLSTGAARFGVGCENCHGPAAAHVKDPKKRTPWRAADQCARCHDHENSPAFNYDAYWAKIAHGKKGVGR